jgi:hypothetical protein
MATVLSIINSTSNLAKLGIIKYEGIGSNGLVYTSFDNKAFRICTKDRFASLNELADPAKSPEKNAIRQKYLSHSQIAPMAGVMTVKPVEKKVEPVVEAVTTEEVATA